MSLVVGVLKDGGDSREVFLRPLFAAYADPVVLLQVHIGPILVQSCLFAVLRVVMPGSIQVDRAADDQLRSRLGFQVALGWWWPNAYFQHAFGEHPASVNLRRHPAKANRKQQFTRTEYKFWSKLLIS
jgi:hypothetical protein